MIYLAKLFLGCLLIVAIESSACELKFGVRQFPPFVVKNEKHQWQGKDIELFTLLSKALNCRAVFIETPFGEALRWIKHGRIDVISQLSITTQRKEYLNFVGPIRQQSISLLTSSNVIENISELEQILALPYTFGHREGIFIGDEFEQLFRENSLLSNKFVNIHSTTNIVDLIQKGRISGYFEDDIYNQYIIEKFSSDLDLKIHPIKLHIGDVHLGVSKKSIPTSFYLKIAEEFNKLKQANKVRY